MRRITKSHDQELVTLSFRVPPKIKKFVEKRAAKLGISPSEYVKRLLEDHALVIGDQK